MPYRAIIFDLDGTLLDTLDDLADSVNVSLGQLHLPTHPVAAYKYFVGDGIENLVRRALPDDRRDDATFEQCLSLVRAQYAERWADKTRPYSGVVKLLDALTARGTRRAVLSNKPAQFTQLCVDRLLAGWHFDMVVGASPDLPRKPDPTGALQVAERLGVAPAEILYLGDTGTDMETAVRAGMYPVGALWGFRPADELTAHGARRLIAAPLELLDLLG